VTLVEPKSVPIDWYLSPSSMNQASKCEISVLYMQSKEVKPYFARPNLQGILGTIAHDVLAQFALGGASSEEFQKKWDFEVNSWRTKLRADALGVIPEAAKWPGYWYTYARAKSRCVSNHDPSESQKTETRSVLIRELWLADEQRMLGGVPDLVYSDVDNRVIIRDYKTGRRENALESGKMQLMFYAHLVEHVTGREPMIGELDFVSGAPERFVFQRQEISDTVKESSGIRDRLVSGGARHTNEPEVCFSCNYKAICPVSLIESNSIELRRVDLIGELTNVQKVNNDSEFTFTLNLDNSKGLATLANVSAREIVWSVGERLLVCGAERISGERHFKADWSTRIVSSPW
jgi:CRISPR/Cas system-associated exonuclease Cas4 (RecB family)